MGKEEDAIKEICTGIEEGTIHDRKSLMDIKRHFAATYKLENIPSNAQIVKILGRSPEFLKKKPIRTMSGVAIVAVMSRPAPCPHGKCTYCPGGPDYNVPQSYTGNEPAAMRAIQNRFHPFLQVYRRIEQLRSIGHPTDKIELIVMGGTFPSQDLDYQEYFVRECLSAMNLYTNRVSTECLEKILFGSSDENNLSKEQCAAEKILLNGRPILLEDAQRANERAHNRCIGITFESRPDWALEPQIDRMLRYGGTRVELGVQTVYDYIYSRVGRGHTTADTKKATALLKDQGFKINYHLMPGLPGSDPERDIRMIERIFTDPSYKPDMIKFYTCLVMEGTKLHENYKKGKYTPYSSSQTVELLVKAKALLPKWVRTMRIQRDIPTTIIAAGAKSSNIGQMVYEKMKKQKIQCKCIRCREVGLKMYKENIIPQKKHVKMKKLTYNASGGKEAFLSFEDVKNDAIIGFLRMRLPGKSIFRKEITQKTGIVRELHVYGPLAPIGRPRNDIWWQHQGYGSKLLKEAEKIAREGYDKNKMIIISGIGVREYYRKFGYKKEGPYMSKAL
ncbi:MAG: tRNA uridine(34) 5-carboxymethylaminomethyl modification radical SAM/GNAT enzyme Elp3 [Candidatus Methanofastidiosia archaeon]